MGYVGLSFLLFERGDAGVTSLFRSELTIPNGISTAGGSFVPSSTQDSNLVPSGFTAGVPPRFSGPHLVCRSRRSTFPRLESRYTTLTLCGGRGS